MFSKYIKKLMTEVIEHPHIREKSKDTRNNFTSETFHKTIVSPKLYGLYELITEIDDLNDLMDRTGESESRRFLLPEYKAAMKKHIIKLANESLHILLLMQLQELPEDKDLIKLVASNTQELEPVVNKVKKRGTDCQQIIICPNCGFW